MYQQGMGVSYGTPQGSSNRSNGFSTSATKAKKNLNHQPPPHSGAFFSGQQNKQQERKWEG